MLFWAWCAISLVWLIARRVNASRANKAAEPAMAEAAETPTVVTEPSDAKPLPTTPPISTHAASEADLVLPGDEWADAPEMPMATAPATPAPPPLPASVAQPVPAEPAMAEHIPATAPASVPVPDLPQPVSPHAEPAPAAVPPISEIRGLSDIMAGMQMPCDLAPLMGEAGGTSIGLRRATFATTTHRPHEVGGALATELERLGMTIQSVSENQAVATRGADSVMLTIHRTAEMFPTAPEMAVVVEMDVV